MEPFIHTRAFAGSFHLEMPLQDSFLCHSDMRTIGVRNEKRQNFEVENKVKDEANIV